MMYNITPIRKFYICAVGQASTSPSYRPAQPGTHAARCQKYCMTLEGKLEVDKHRTTSVSGFMLLLGFPPLCAC